MKRTEDFSLFRRKGKRTYYFYYRVGGKRIFRSTKETTKAQAVDAARAFMENAAAGTFGDFAKYFFVWGQCKWIEKQHAFERSFSQSTANNRRHYLVKHLLPRFGKTLLADITKADVEEFLLSLKKYSSQSRNHVLYTLRIILKDAEDRGLIKTIAERLQGFTVHHKKRGIFTLDELKTLFPIDLSSVWGNLKQGFLFYVMLVTGIRSGEARALTWAKWQAGGLMIDRAVKNSGEIGSTKTGEIRFVPLNSRAAGYLTEWRKLTPYPRDEDLLFFGEDGKRPYTSRALAWYFAKVLDGLGFDRKGRVLCVHGLRHSFNTYLKTVLPAALLQAITGHKSDSMTKTYDNPALEEMSKRVDGARDALEKLF